MSLQFNRQYTLTLSNADGEVLVIEELRITFQLNKTLLGYPTRGRIEIYNLSEENIQRIGKRYSVATLEAGYATTKAHVFTSNIMNFYKSRQGVDSVFNLILAGEAPAWADSVFVRTYREGMPPSTILRDVAGSFEGVIIGTLLEDASWEAKLSSVTHAGNARTIMDKLARDYNFDWAIHDGQIDVIPRGQVLTDQPIYVITPETGLIGSPTLTELGADFRVLLNPDIMLGRQVQMSAESVQLGQEGLEFRRVRTTADGFYKVMDIRLMGDTRGLDWYCDIIGWRVGDEPRK